MIRCRLGFLRTVLIAITLLFLGSCTGSPEQPRPRQERSVFQVRPANHVRDATDAWRPTSGSRFAWAPSTRGSTIPPAQLGVLAPFDAARAHLSARAQLLGLAPGYLSSLTPRLVHDLGHGSIVAKFQQALDGIEVFNREVNLVMDRQRQLVALSGDLSPRAAVAPSLGIARARGEFPMGAEDAIASAYRDLGGDPGALQLAHMRSAPPYEHYRATRTGDLRLPGELRAKKVYFDRGDRLLGAYYLELTVVDPSRRSRQILGMVVSATDGQVLFRMNRLLTAEPFSYRVWASPESLLPESTPYCGQGIPHPTGAPDGYLPTTPCARSMVALSHAGISTGDPWLPEGATETVGNNADVFFHLCLDANGYYSLPDEFLPENGDFRAPLSSHKTFDYPYDLDASPYDPFGCETATVFDPADPQLRAKIVQDFYIANTLHDLMYDHGYDEASGNNQESNYGRGGLEGDPLLVFASACNTWTLSSADGKSSVLSIGRNSASWLNRSADYDLQVFSHEWMHVLQHRLIGDAHGLSNNQGSALGEGWSDFFGLLMSIRDEQADLTANQDWLGTFGLGAYFNQDYCSPGSSCTPPGPGEDQCYYFGTRRYPICADLGKSPLTFRYIEDDVPLPAGIPNFFWKGRIDNAEGHNAGEIWSQALWQCYRSLLTDPRLSFAEARDRMLDYLVASMKATPLEPTFTEARDALLAVARATDEIDFQAFKKAFAARGMGAGAVSPDRYSIEFHGVMESFLADGPFLKFASANLDDRKASTDADDLLDVGETGTLTLTLRNTGFVDLAATTVRVTTTADCSFPKGAEFGPIASSPSQQFSVEVPVTLNSAGSYQSVDFVIAFEDLAAGFTGGTATVSFRVNYDIRRIATGDDAEHPETRDNWLVQSTNNGYGGGYVARDHKWERASWDGASVFRAPAGKGSYESSLISPWLVASADRDLILGFDHVYNFIQDDGTRCGFGRVEIQRQDAPDVWAVIGSEFTDQSPDYPALEPQQLNLGRDHAGKVIRVRFYVYFDAALQDFPTGWALDNIFFQGIDNTPFLEVVRNGASAPAGNWPPLASFDWSAAGMTLVFTDRSSDSDGQLIGWRWTFGDGAEASVRNPKHDYADPGEYFVTLVVQDDQGAKDVTGLRVMPIMPLESGVAHPRPFHGKSQFSIEVPSGASILEFSSPAASDTYYEFLARLGKPVVLDFDNNIYEYDSYVAKYFSHGDTNPLRLSVSNPSAGTWYLMAVGDGLSMLGSYEVQPADGGEVGEPDGGAEEVPGGDLSGTDGGNEGGGGCDCGASATGATGVPGWFGLGLLLLSRRRRPNSNTGTKTLPARACARSPITSTRHSTGAGGKSSRPATMLGRSKIVSF